MILLSAKLFDSIFLLVVNWSGDYMILVGRDEILSRFARIRAVLKTLHKLYPEITCEKFHLGKVESVPVDTRRRFNDDMTLRCCTTTYRR